MIPVFKRCCFLEPVLTEISGSNLVLAQKKVSLAHKKSYWSTEEGEAIFLIASFWLLLLANKKKIAKIYPAGERSFSL
jgi:hypothetical protein